MAEAKVSLLLQLKDQVSKQMGKMKSSFVKNANAMKGSALLFGGAFAGITAAVALSVGAYKEQQRVDTELKTRLESTGYAAGMTAEEVKKLAGELQTTTGVSDEVTQSAQNMLLSFTNIGKEVFPATTEAALDMTAAMNGGKITQEGLKASSIMLGKALNDPIKGVTALTRVGVTFTDGQKSMIEEMATSGDVIGAQELMLAELKKEFGGTASNLDTLVGAQRAAKSAFGDMQEKIGEQFAPIILKASLLIKDLALWIQKIIPHIKDFIVPITILIGVFTGLLAVGGAIVTLGPMIGLAFHAALGPIGLITLALAGLVAGFIYFKNSSSGVALTVRAIFSTMGIIIKEELEKIKEQLGKVADFFKGVGETFSNISRKIIDKVTDLTEKITSKFKFIGDAVNKVKGFFGGLKKGVEEADKGIVASAAKKAAGVVEILKGEIQKQKDKIAEEKKMADTKAAQDRARAAALAAGLNEDTTAANEVKAELDQAEIDTLAEMNAVAEEARKEFEDQKLSFDTLTAEARTKLLTDTLGKERIAKDAQRITELKAEGKHEEAKKLMNKMYKDAFIKMNDTTIKKVDEAQKNHWETLLAGDKISKDDREKIMGDMQKGFKAIIGLMGKDSMVAFNMMKGLAITQGLINTYDAAIAAYKSLAGIPIVGPALGIAAGIAATVSGIANVNAIRKQKPPQMEVGGRVLTEGLAHLHPAEVILNKNEAENYGASKILNVNFVLNDETVQTMVVQLEEAKDEMIEAGAL